MSSDAVRNVWCSAVEAARLLGCDSKKVPKLAAKGFITVRRLPGCDPRYLMSDVEQLANRATVTATIASRRPSEDAEAVTTAYVPSEPAATCENGGDR